MLKSYDKVNRADMVLGLVITEKQNKEKLIFFVQFYLEQMQVVLIPTSILIH